MGGETAILYGFRFSSCSWRVRAALHIKGIPFVEKNVDIVKQLSHLCEEYRRINPAQKVPSLVIDGETVVESMAILQYIEDTRPRPSLTPDKPLSKTRMREICETIVSGIQPLQNVSLRSWFECEEKYLQKGRQVIDRGLQTLEALLQKSAGSYCVGDQLTMADLCLVPQVFNATNRFKMNVDNYVTVSKLYQKLLEEETFKATHPKNVNPE
ncbi:probable maleylacetoacetate isomerase 1 [Plodia interpunctella]|uniref:probable maleylacetoacetate isomerase 1 n=1 Tax=Plodia interpunctella TaxID=58824 RepID=UPI002368CBC8|nr:probable maleylacetoacetate isomerase 1 [Plodia interpunctella]